MSRPRLGAAAVVALAGVSFALQAAPRARVAQSAPHAASTSEAADADAHAAAPAPAIELRRLRRDGARYVAPTSGGGEAVLTLRPDLQELAEQLLAQHEIPYGAVVVLDAHDGRVLALAGRSQAEPRLSIAELALRPWAPAASVFKLITAAALLATGAVTPATEVCYHGGFRSLDAAEIVGDPRLDRECRTLEYGVARSQNALIARLAYRHLTAETLRRTAEALGFNAPIDFAAPVVPSRAAFPTAPIDLARVAAGFWSVELSPLHGALIAQALAAGGEARAPWIVDGVRDRPGAGAARPVGHPERGRRVLPEAVARAVGQMMVATTRYGTARTAFHDRRGRPLLPGVDVAGKTGSLDRLQPSYLNYSWFVGFAPADAPEIAFAVLLANPPRWQIKAHYVARRLVEAQRARRPLARK